MNYYFTSFFYKQHSEYTLRTSKTIFTTGKVNKKIQVSGLFKVSISNLPVAAWLTIRFARSLKHFLRTFCGFAITEILLHAYFEYFLYTV